MKRLIFALGILFTNSLIGQSFKQSINSEVIGQRIFMIDGSASFPRNYNGAAILDFTGDNLKDFILPSYYGPTNNYDVSYLKFFKNQGNGTFSEVTKQYINPDIASGLYFIGSNDGRSVVFDFNKDGKMDFAFPSLWENNNYENYDKTYGFKKNRDYYFNNNEKNLASISYLGFHSPGFFYQDSLGFKKAYNLFDKQTFTVSQAVMNADIDNDSYEDLLIQSTGYVTKDSAITDWINGIVIWKNNKGSGFKFSKLNFTDTTNKYDFRFDEEGGIGIGDYNNDGFKDILVYGVSTPYIYNRFNQTIDSSAWSANFRQYDRTKEIRETRIYFNNNGVFNDLNYKVIPGVRAKYSKSIDINGDGKTDFIALWKNYLASGKYYIDSITNKDGINTQLYVMINKGDNIFEDQTQKYFPSNNFKFPKMSLIDFDLKDLDGDGFLDIFPISGANDNVNNILGGYHPDTAGSHNTFFYKNYNNNYFRKILIDSFFIVKEWSNYKDLKNIDSVWKNFYLKLNSTPEIKGEALLDDLYYLNNMYLEDFNNDKKLDLLGFKGYNNSFQSFMINKYGFNDNLKLQIGMALFSQCNLIKPTFSTNNFSICSGDSLKLSITNVNKGDSLKWYFGSKTDFTNVSNKTFTDSAKLFVIRTDSLGCTISSDTVNLVKLINPSAPTISRDSANYLVANTYGITWYKDGAAIPDTTQKIKPSTPGSYTAKTTQNGCISPMSNPYYFLVTDIINLSKDEYIKVAPNPFQNQVNLDFIIKGYQRLNIEVYELSTGNRVKSIVGLTQGSKVDLGGLSSGTYVLRVSSLDNKITHQFKMIKL